MAECMDSHALTDDINLGLNIDALKHNRTSKVIDIY